MTKKKVTKKKIDFDKLFLKGHKSYDTVIGDWWEKQSSNGSHQKAYQAVADYVSEVLSDKKNVSPKKSSKQTSNSVKNPKWIVDYACGGGHFLQKLALRFPKSNIVALDGSKKMLQQAKGRMEAIDIEADLVDAKKSFDAKGPRIRLVQTTLPNFSLPKGKADVVIFVFPNLTPSPADQDYYDKHGYLSKPDTKVCTILSRLREMDPEDEVTPIVPKEMYESLMTDRVICRNLRHLLKPKGKMFKVDYANAHRSELSHLTQMRSFFAEGALTEAIKDLKAPVFFKYLSNKFHRSQVILDVFHQTGDPSDKTGGFFTSVFDAI